MLSPDLSEALELLVGAAVRCHLDPREPVPCIVEANQALPSYMLSVLERGAGRLLTLGEVAACSQDYRDRIKALNRHAGADAESQQQAEQEAEHARRRAEADNLHERRSAGAKRSAATRAAQRSA